MLLIHIERCMCFVTYYQYLHIHNYSFLLLNYITFSFFALMNFHCSVWSYEVIFTIIKKSFQKVRANKLMSFFLIWIKRCILFEVWYHKQCTHNYLLLLFWLIKLIIRWSDLFSILFELWICLKIYHHEQCSKLFLLLRLTTWIIWCHDQF